MGQSNDVPQGLGENSSKPNEEGGRPYFVGGFFEANFADQERDARISAQGLTRSGDSCNTACLDRVMEGAFSVHLSDSTRYSEGTEVGLVLNV